MSTERQHKCVAWREGFASSATSGFCVEIRRDKDATAAETLCGKTILFPGSVYYRTPTCLGCAAMLAGAVEEERK